MHQWLHENSLIDYVFNHVVDALVYLVKDGIEIVPELLEDVEPLVGEALEVYPCQALEHLLQSLAHVVLQFVNLVLDFNHLIAVKRKPLP